MKKYWILFLSLFGIVVIAFAQTVVPCPNCGGAGGFYTMYGPVVCPYCGGSGGIIVQNNESNVIFKGNSNKSDGYEFLRDVELFTSNSNNTYSRHSTHQLYKYWTGSTHILYLDKSWIVSNCSYPRSKDFTYFVVDRWGITYYFN